MSKEVLLLLRLLINSTCAKITIVRGERIERGEGGESPQLVGQEGDGWDIGDVSGVIWSGLRTESCGG